MLGTSPLLGQALQNSWDRPALGTGPSKFLGQARSWDRPFKILGTSPLLGHALQNAWVCAFVTQCACHIPFGPNHGQGSWKKAYFDYAPLWTLTLQGDNMKVFVWNIKVIL
jgi:hypothetical protein